jgi:hypothetical protein
MRLNGTLPAVMKRIELLMKEKRTALESVKTCPQPCHDRTVTVTLKSGKPRRVGCPIADLNCAYGRLLKGDLDSYLARVLLEIGVPRKHLECLADHRNSPSLRAACEWTYRGFLMVCGNPGTGKSFTAACLLRKYLNSRIPDRMDRHTWEEAGRSCASTAWLNASELYGDREAVAAARTARLLVLDDFGCDGDSRAGQATAVHVISARYDAMLPTVITTDLAVENIKARYGCRTAEKIVGKPQDGCMIVECGQQPDYMNSEGN